MPRRSADFKYQKAIRFNCSNNAGREYKEGSGEKEQANRFHIYHLTDSVAKYSHAAYEKSHRRLAM